MNTPKPGSTLKITGWDKETDGEWKVLDAEFPLYHPVLNPDKSRIQLTLKRTTKKKGK